MMRFADTDPVERRYLLLGLLRGSLMSVLLMVAYYTLPLDRGLDGATAAGLVAGLVAFAAMVVWQINSIAGSDRPRLRAFEALSVSVPFLLLLFAATYFLIARDRAESFTESLTRTDALYFTLTVFSTVGFGDITPRTETARIVTMIQMTVNLVAVGVIARVVLGAVQLGLQRRSTPADPDPGEPNTPPDALRPEA
ncbi:potassium channel family protein [Embleya sp. NBC_00896]|uniref:potassium channel family protein n=1 Tax=Embleya sp. NBC_00896 TaxID=2975961 RepID=UPI002F912A6E|nr:potassium channel family protein [Embleya sp. NBC_00896]